MQRVPAAPSSFLIFSSLLPFHLRLPKSKRPQPDRTFIASPRLVTFDDCSAASLSISVRIALAYGLKAGFRHSRLWFGLLTENTGLK